VVIVAGYRIQPPWWDTAADIREMNNAMADGSGYEGTDEYVPAGADPYELNKKQPRVANSSGMAKRTEGMKWGPTEKRFAVQTDGMELLTLRLFNYPAWEVTVNGEHVDTQTTEITGQMMIPITPGRKDIRIRFGRTRDRTIGGVLSLIILALMIMLLLVTRPPKTEIAQT